MVAIDVKRLRGESGFLVPSENWHMRQYANKQVFLMINTPSTYLIYMLLIIDTHKSLHTI